MTFLFPPSFCLLKLPNVFLTKPLLRNQLLEIFVLLLLTMGCSWRMRLSEQIYKLRWFRTGLSLPKTTMLSLQHCNFRLEQTKATKQVSDIWWFDFCPNKTLLHKNEIYRGKFCTFYSSKLISTSIVSSTHSIIAVIFPLKTRKKQSKEHEIGCFQSKVTNDLSTRGEGKQSIRPLADKTSFTSRLVLLLGSKAL